MKLGNILILVPLLLVAFCFAEEQTCTSDGDCSATEEASANETDGGCENTHDQCEFWASLGEWTGVPSFVCGCPRDHSSHQFLDPLLHHFRRMREVSWTLLRDSGAIFDP